MKEVTRHFPAYTESSSPAEGADSISSQAGTGAGAGTGGSDAGFCPGILALPLLYKIGKQTVSNVIVSVYLSSTISPRQTYLKVPKSELC